MNKAAPRGPHLRVVAINDVYVLDNLPRLQGLIAWCRDHEPADRLLITLAGDFVAPSLLSSLDSGRGMVDCLNALGFTHVTLGNHEDDIATSELSERVRELQARCLGTNVEGFVPELPKHDVVAVTAPDGRTVNVGLVGIVMNDATVYQRVPFGGASLLDPNEAARTEARRLRDQGCDAVIALTHQSIEEDRALLAEAAPPFTIVLGGHDHQVMLEKVQDLFVAKAGADAFHALVVDLIWPDLGPPDVTVRLEDVARYAEDPALRARVDTHQAKVRALSSATLMVLEPGRTLSSVGTRAHQTTMGTLLATKTRKALHADCCVFNGGGVRGNRDYVERFSFGDLETEVPFDNELVVAPMPGAVLARAIAFSRSQGPREFGGFLQVCDAIVLDAENAIVTVHGQPFDPARLYRVALVRNLFTGMDGVQPLVDFARAQPEAIPESGAGREVKLVLLESFARSLWHELGGFARLDVDHDGKVDVADVTRALEGRNGASATAGILLRALDRNQDGSLTADEASDLAPDEEGT